MEPLYLLMPVAQGFGSLAWLAVEQVAGRKLRDSALDKRAAVARLLTAAAIQEASRRSLLTVQIPWEPDACQVYRWSTYRRPCPTKIRLIKVNIC